MSKKIRYGMLSGSFGTPVDQYVAGGYKPAVDSEEIIASICRVPGLEGALLEEGTIPEGMLPKATRALSNSGKTLIGLLPDVWTGEYVKGSLTSTEKRTRKQAVDHIKRWMDLAKENKAPLIVLWFGNDGTDYYFTADYGRRWDQIIEGLKEVCTHDASVKVAICNKLLEPRNHCHISTTGKTVALIKEVGEENLGICLDPSHSMQSQELLAENIAFIDRFLDRSKLFVSLCADNWRSWDDMKIVGSVNTLEYLEYLFWLDKINYDGWVVSDQIAWREDSVASAELSIDMLKGFDRLLGKIDRADLEAAISEGDSVKALNTIRKVMLP